MAEKETVTLANICGGAIEEVFQRELNAILINVNDVNTDAETKRKLSLEFTFEPFKDRTGMQVTFHCKSKLVGADAVKGQIFLQRKGVNTIAIPGNDPRQMRFGDTPKEEIQ